jgi:hypothetical protein
MKKNKNGDEVSMDLDKEVRRLRKQYARDVHAIGRLNSIYRKVCFGRSVSHDDIRFINSLKK